MDKKGEMVFCCFEMCTESNLLVLRLASRSTYCGVYEFDDRLSEG